MAERVSMRDEITSVDTGWTKTRFESGRRASPREAAGKERRRRSCFDRRSSLVRELEVLAEVLSGIGGPLD